jgi:hypothetical protein
MRRPGHQVQLRGLARQHSTQQKRNHSESS